MKGNRKNAPSLGLWDMVALVLAGLLYVDVLACVAFVIAGGGVLLVSALEAGFVAGVLFLLGMAAYFLGKGRGLGRLFRRLLLGALIASGMLLFWVAGMVALAIYAANAAA